MQISQRLLSLDAFRGFTIAGMILVNDPGTWAHVYPPMRHASWDGCTPTDLVFPFFVFIMGVSMYFSLSKYNHQLSSATARKILKRTALIFLVGLLLTWFPFYHKAVSDYRIMNVLQRIALAYGAAAFIGILMPSRALWYVIGGILLFYWWAMWAFGGGPDPFSLETNFARALDLKILGESHLYGGYGIPFDPEGLFHSIPTVGTALIGFQIGRLIKLTENRSELVKKLLIYGLIGIGLGLLWDMVFPINKPLWSSSYVLYTAGLGSCLLGLFMEFYDLQKRTFAKTFLVVFGTNAIFAYVLHGLLFKISYSVFRWDTASGGRQHPFGWVYQNVFAEVLGNNAFASLVYAMTYVFLCWGITYLLYRRKIFLKV
ncbi:MAG: DUF5009 domain-containing protein [Bacteroidota bacterium]